jgi:hypothetical protein
VILKRPLYFTNPLHHRFGAVSLMNCMKLKTTIARTCVLLAVILSAFITLDAAAEENSDDIEAAILSAKFYDEVDRRLELPESELTAYAELLHATLASAGIRMLTPQLLVLVDRSPLVQAALVLWKADDGSLYLIGTAPVSTGRPGSYEYFETPLGVFRHSVGNPDFRAEGIRNSNGILGYGPKGTRVFDFGWQLGTRTWDQKGASLMRLQLHSTDTDLLEPRVGTPQSKGCIRIPLSLNQFIDHYGILDADYEDAAHAGKHISVWNRDRQATRWSGRYLVIVDSERTVRPAWATPSNAEHIPAH